MLNQWYIFIYIPHPMSRNNTLFNGSFPKLFYCFILSNIWELCFECLQYIYGTNTIKLFVTFSGENEKCTGYTFLSYAFIILFILNIWWKIQKYKYKYFPIICFHLQVSCHRKLQLLGCSVSPEEIDQFPSDSGTFSLKHWSILFSFKTCNLPPIWPSVI